MLFITKKERVLADSDQFVLETQPAGGLSTRHEFYNRYGDSYGTCIHIYDTPTIFNEFWLLDLTELPNTMMMVDYMTDSSIVYEKEVSDSVDEMKARQHSAKSQAETDIFYKEEQLLRELNLSMTNEGEKIKQLHIRIYLNEKTIESLEEKVNDVLIKINSAGYKGIVLLDEQLEEWQAMFLPAEEQLHLRNKPQALEKPAEALGLGFAHNQTLLSDPTGLYYGVTRTGGIVYWDLFHKSAARLYYNLFITGDMGSGKSTTLKKILLDNASKGNFIRGFDKSGEFATVVKEFGGLSIPLDGSKGIINMLQVYPTVTKGETAEIDVQASFSQHLSNLSMIYHILNKDARKTDLKTFESLLWDFYIEQDIWGKASIDITNLPNEAYPTLSEFITFLEGKMSAPVDSSLYETYKDILITFRELTKQYANIFDGTTSIQELSDNQVVFFDIATLSSYKEEIFDCQMYIALNNIMGNVMRIGKDEKEAWEKGIKEFVDIRRFLIIVDECHNILNMNKAYATDFFVTLMSEARKFFGGIALATQRIERMFPRVDNVSDKEMAQAASKLKEIFGLTQYKIILKQDVTSIPFMKSIFEDNFTELEYSLMSQFKTGKEVNGSQGILSISGSDNLHMTFQVTEEELAIFKGGA